MREPDAVLDVPLTPAAAIARVGGAINRREQRLFGILKTKQEYVGIAAGDSFEIWERQHRAVHAVARVRPHAGGTRVEVCFVLPRTTRVVAAVFFALYFTGTIGLSLRDPDPVLSAVEIVVITVGAVLLATGFAYSARRQRADLAGFVARLFSERTSTGG